MRSSTLYPILFGLLCAGCLSTNMYQTAQVLEPGRGVLGAAVNATHVPQACFLERCATANSPSGRVPLVDYWIGTLPFEVVGRVGLAERVDLGGRIGILGARIDLKVQLVDTDVFDLAVDVGLRADLLEAGAFLPVIFSVRPVPEFALFGSVQGVLSRWRGQSDEYAILGGVAVNFGLSLDIDAVAIRPAVTYNYLVLDIELPPGTSEPVFEYLSFGLAVIVSLDGEPHP